MKKAFMFVLSLVFFVFSVNDIKASDLVFSYGAASINNTNGFLVSQIDNRQVYYSFIPGHTYRLDVKGAVNPNTFWIGICNDLNICNPEARNYTDNGDFSITFTDIDSQWFDIWGNCSGFGTCSITSLELYDISPIATPLPTPTPSPTPIPVTKVIFVPGMGASWNIDAFINCKQSGYVGDWTMAPYAKDVYEFAKTSLENAGWNTIPFYYDWRQDVRDNSTKLNTLINSIAPTEKINLVGHSMGGLISRSYIEQQSGGKANKFLAIGTPNQGSALAYPAIGGEQIWTDDLIEKIGSTLFLKHCGKIESFQNTIPTYDYLRDWNTQALKPIATTKLKNNYLPTNFVAPFWGVKVGTIAGNNFPTLKIIDVVNSPKWPDGKPVYKEFSNEGDGTVLVKSAGIQGAISNTVINQSHSGIIGSTEGVNKILEFLGSPGIADPPYIEPVSALIIIGSPGIFWVTDKDGNITQSDQGMVAIINPKDGDYKLQTIPTASVSNFIISKFTADGRTTYNEYTYKGLVQKPKVIRFNSIIEKDEREHENEDFDNNRH